MMLAEPFSGPGRRLRVVAAAAVLLGAIRHVPAASAEVRPPGEVVLHFKTRDLVGRPVSLGELLVTKKVAVLFWDARRATSVQLLKVLDQIYDRYARKGLEILAIEGEGLSPERAQERADQLRAIGTAPGYPLIPDPGGRIARQFRVESTPQLFLIDRAGRIAYHLDGFRTGDEVEIEDRVKEFLGIVYRMPPRPAPRPAEPTAPADAPPVAPARPQSPQEALQEKYRYFGNYFLNRGEPDRAAEYYRQYLELAPADASMWLQLGEAHARQGLYDRAREAWEKVLRIDPENAEADANIRRLLRGEY